ncbi:sulfatase-like hydrolase/transferase [Vallitaleaceae bacterium 9-2]
MVLSAAVCMPSRAMLNTGRQLFSLQGEGQETPNNHALLGETLQKAGYDTFGTGKCHNGVDSYVRSFNHGDAIFFGGMDDHWAVPVHSFDPTGRYDNRRYKTANFWNNNQRDKYISDHIGERHSTELFSKVTSEFILNDTVEDKPFYAYVSFMAPHDPRTMPDRFRKMYDKDKISLPENFMQYHSIEYDNAHCRDELLAPYPRTAEDTKQQLLEYYAMITHIDEEIGKIIQTLKDKDVYEDTIIIYTADNGLSLGQHGLFGQQCHYENSIRVPFLMAGPNIPEKEIRDTYIYLMDIFPTLCEILNIEVPDTVESKSFLDCIIDKDRVCRENLYFAYTDKIRSVKDNRFKLMEHVYDGVLTTQLFDIKNDPLELANLAKDSKYHKDLIRLKKLMVDYRDQWGEEDHPMGANYWKQYRELTNEIGN